MDLRYFMREEDNEVPQSVIKRPYIYGIAEWGKCEWFVAEYIGPHYQIVGFYRGDDAETRAKVACDLDNKKLYSEIEAE